MKPIHLVALLGGAAALYYVTKKRSDAPRHKVPMYSLRANAPGVAGGCIRADGTLVSMKYCESDPSQLEGYFPTGYFSAGVVPCCSGCAQGRACRG